MVSTPFSSRPTTPGKSPPQPNSENLPPIPESNSHPPRRSSLGFLRRSKSGDLVNRGSTGAKLSRKRSANKQQEELLRRQREAHKSPPKLPDIFNGARPPSIHAFGGDDMRAGPTLVSSRPPVMPGRGSIDTYSSAVPHRVPIPPIPGSSPRSAGGDAADPYARTESMTHRGRYSYASSAISTINSPRKVRRRKDPTPFNVLVIGARNSGKTSFLNFLRTSLALPKKRGLSRVDGPEQALPQMSSAETANSAFESSYLETEIDGERVGLTLWDSQGLEKNVVDLQLREMSSFLESKFEETFTEEMKVVRAPGVQDTHIHCVFLLLDPVRLDANVAAEKNDAARARNVMNGKHLSRGITGGLDEDLDLQVLRTLQGKTTVVPLISKADTITTAHMTYLKKIVWDGLKKANLDPLEALGLDDLEGDTGLEEREAVDSSDSSILIKQSNTEAQNVSASGGGPVNPADVPVPTTPHHERSLSRQSQNRSTPNHPADGSNGSHAQIPYLPLSVISPDMYDPGTIGRKFPWGFADPYNDEHCDFIRLKEAVFSHWRGELREASRELWYEGWRTSRLRKRRN